MRELKFRAWLIKKRKYIDIDTLYCANGKVCGLVCDGVVYDSDDVILEQYTGLKDKNGKKIYEGDIVRDANGVCAEVKYFICGFDFRPIYPTEKWKFKYISEYTEVIGNIHENADLLEEE